MTVYAIAQLKMTDRAAYDRYQARFFDVFRKYDGRLLAADEQPRVLEGPWPFDKLVMMSFPDEAAFLAFSNSPDYEEHLARSQGGRAGNRAAGQGIRAGGLTRRVTTTARSRTRTVPARRRDRDGSRSAARSNADQGRGAPRNVMMSRVPSRIENRCPGRGIRLRHTLRRVEARGKRRCEPERQRPMRSISS